MQVGVSSYSFIGLIETGAMTPLDCPARAKELGFDFIEYAAMPLPEGKALSDYAAEIRRAADRAEMPILHYAVGADLLTGSDGNLEEEIARVKGEVDIAEILGAPTMRHDASSGFGHAVAGSHSFDDALPRLIEGCRAITEYAAEKNIRTTVENHGHFCQDSDRMEKLVRGAAHANFGLLLDMGNFVCVDEDPLWAVRRLSQYAFYVHAKDFHLKSASSPFPGEGWALTRGGNFRRGAIIGHGDVPVLSCLRAICRAGYDGPISIEFEGIEDPMLGIRLSHENLRRLLDLAGTAIQAG